MYIIINENQYKVLGITKNAEKVVLKLDGNHVIITNFNDLINPEIEHEWRLDEILLNKLRNVKASNQVLLIKLIAEQLEKDGCEDYIVQSDIVWNDNGLSDLNVRVTIPHDVVFNNPNYRALVGHVEGLMSENKAFFHVNNGLVYLYFLALLPEHEALLSADNNVLIEYKSK